MRNSLLVIDQNQLKEECIKYDLLKYAKPEDTIHTVALTILRQLQ